MSDLVPLSVWILLQKTVCLLCIILCRCKL